MYNNQTLLEMSQSEHPVLGSLWAAGNEHGLACFAFGIHQTEFVRQVSKLRWLRHTPVRISRFKTSLPSTALEQVADYLAGTLRHFTIPINWQPYTEFQAAVYRAVLEVPYGQTRTYGQIAAQIDRPRAARAVGAANGFNPLPIIIPCHRLVGKDGSLRGYGGTGGVQTKQWLLDLEKQHMVIENHTPTA